MIREKVKNLWKLCFNDSEEFTEMYFRLRYNNDINIAIQSGEEVIAALQMLPYPMTFEGEDIHTAYISGACTHPDFRNRGVMHELLSQAFARMLHNNVALSTLIPAEPWLFNYYARSGYAPRHLVFSLKTIYALKIRYIRRGNPDDFSGGPCIGVHIGIQYDKTIIQCDGRSCFAVVKRKKRVNIRLLQLLHDF